MQTYQIIVEYVGTNFVGWQIQNNGPTVQKIIQIYLKKITKEKIIIFGSGRTDTGVHAIGQSAHFKMNYKIKNKINFIKSLNFFSSKHGVAIIDIKKKIFSFHARHDVKKRKYKYIIINRQASLVLEKNRAWHLRKKLNIDLMKRGAKILINIKDFSTFRASSCSAKSPIKTMEKVIVKKINNKIEIIFVSKSFLQQQVRSMVGCLKYLGEKKWTLKQFRDSALSKKRVNCAPPAPPHGLYLQEVKY